jgi:hypothetical protein
MMDDEGRDWILIDGEGKPKGFKMRQQTSKRD